MLTKCVVAKDIKHFQEKNKVSPEIRVVMFEDIKSGKLPAGFESKYVDLAQTMLDLLSFNRIIDRSFRAASLPGNKLGAKERQKLYEMHK